MKITRIIEYEGTSEWLEKQLGGSMPDGVKELPGGKISILTVGNTPMLEVYSAACTNLSTKALEDLSE